MRFERHGAGTSAPEVTNISPQGIWLLVGEREYFLPFEKFPWFASAPVASVLRLEQPSPGHLRWPDLDVDLDLSAIARPDDYPLVARS